MCNAGEGLFAFAKFVINELDNACDGLFCRLAVCRDGDKGPLAGRQHHNAHDTFGIHLSVIFANIDFARITGRKGDQFRSGPCMEAKFVADNGLCAKHELTSAASVAQDTFPATDDGCVCEFSQVHLVVI